MELDDWDDEPEEKPVKAKREARPKTSEERQAARAKTETAIAMQWAMYGKAYRKWLDNGGMKSGKLPPQKPSNAQPPSQKQMDYLNMLLGGCSYPSMIRFVEYANELPSGYGYFPRWQNEGQYYLSRFLWIQAISLIKNGRNVHGTDRDIYARCYEDAY